MTTLRLRLRIALDISWLFSWRHGEGSPMTQMTKTTVHDVAAYILQRSGAMSAMKLQKLVYYSQAWSLVWDERSLFPERIEAWANGPVCKVLYARHKGRFQVDSDLLPDADPDSLDAAAQETIDSVLKFYGERTAQALSDLTHAEPPWKDARGDMAPGEACSTQITNAAMAEYYGSL